MASDAEFRKNVRALLAQHVNGGSFLDGLKKAVDIAGTVASNPLAQKLATKAFGLGQSGGKRRRRVKGGDFLNDLGNIAGVAMKVAPLLGLGASGGKRRKRGKGVSGGAELTPYQQYLLAHGSGTSGGSFLDDIPVVGTIASALGLGESGGKQKRKPSAHAMNVKAYMKAHPGVSLPQASKAVAKHR